MNFQRGIKYSRPDVKEAFGIGRFAKGGNWDTGIVEHEGEFVIFTNVGTEGRTGHDYDNNWDGEKLRWVHKNGSTLRWSSVQKLLRSGQPIHLFWREANDGPFTYAGLASAESFEDTSPVKIVWSFS